MVSNLPLSCEMDHDGVMRRSVAREGPLFAAFALKEAVEMMTETSVGVGWKAMVVQDKVLFQDPNIKCSIQLVSEVHNHTTYDIRY
jgi:hypothetical protein